MITKQKQAEEYNLAEIQIILENNVGKEKKIEEIRTEADVPITEAFELYLRSHFFKIKQNNATKKVLSYWKDLFDKNLNKNLEELDACIENQSKFSQLIADLIESLDFEGVLVEIDTVIRNKNVFGRPFYPELSAFFGGGKLKF